MKYNKDDIILAIELAFLIFGLLILIFIILWIVINSILN